MAEQDVKVASRNRRLKKEIILIVDDKSHQLMRCRDIIGELGYAAVYFDHLQDALSFISENDVSMTIFHLHIKSIGSLELTRQINALNHEYDIVIVTDPLESNNLIEHFHNGATALIPTPVNSEMVNIILTQITQKRHLKLLAKQREFYRQLSCIDGLTNLYNHRFFHNLLDKELARANRYHYPVSLIIIDVDFFKNYNDMHGHLAGDDVLRNIGFILINSVRKSDMVARYGGEEFTVILPKTDKEEAVQLADRLRTEVEEFDFAYQEQQPNGNLTISLGVANFPDDALLKAKLIDCADKALYSAKENGKNQVYIYSQMLVKD